MKASLRFLLLVLLAGAQVAESQSVIFLVRHADRASSAGDSLLSPRGEERAKCLATTLSGANISAVFATEIKRTQQTAAPVAQEFHLQTTIIAKADLSGLVRQLKESGSRPVLVVGHADTLPALVRQLGAGEIPSLGDREYDRLILIPLADGKAQTAINLRYCSALSDAAGIDSSMR